ncbi:uncharacterized protein LOC107413723 [Ziziphus jujuba]|uniref:Uncharacterized protein LOC107413723 n=1 Tax=Ziziphus jujuba TaxID=326968 RepID=A0A6P3ZGL6_ZIZJJ|nr:uncharacterized protein LOC107413723 [Ziziphus jujuba]
MDLIGKVYRSSKQHMCIIVAINYFTKWVKARLVKTINQADVTKFINEVIIHRFGILETITTDCRTVFIGEAVETFVKEYGIKLTHSTPYFAQASGQFKTSKRSGTSTISFALTYRHDAIPLMEVTMRSLQIVQQHNLTLA